MAVDCTVGLVVQSSFLAKWLAERVRDRVRIRVRVRVRARIGLILCFLSFIFSCLTCIVLNFNEALTQCIVKLHDILHVVL